MRPAASRRAASRVASEFRAPATGCKDYRRQRGQQDNPEDDDNIQSRGGFGG